MIKVSWDRSLGGVPPVVERVGFVCEDPLAQLEESLNLLLRQFESLRAESANLRRDNRELKESLEELERENRKRKEEADRLREDFLKIKARIERVIRNVAILEESPVVSIRPMGEGKR